MNDQREQTLEELVAQAEMAAATLKAQLAEKIAAERPNALAIVLDTIRKHGFTRAELDKALRKRPKVARGPRKPKATGPAGIINGAQAKASTSAP
jgi:hypothetical protein